MSTTYIANGATLRLDAERCNGCRMCLEVCPHAAFRVEDGRAAIVARDRCMECGACARNCATGALAVRAGVGCAAAVITGLVRGTAPTCGCGSDKTSKSCCGS